MLPPGHVAAGYLTAKALLKIVHPVITQTQQNHLIAWSMFFSFAPDLDSFVAFAEERAWFVKNQKHNHRKFYSHAPILWLIAGLIIYFAASSEYWKLFGLIVWLASWSHFLLDSITYGIMWLWPFDRKVFAITDRGKSFVIPENTFIGYWWDFTKQYMRTATFYAEIIIVVSALIIYFR